MTANTFTVLGFAGRRTVSGMGLATVATTAVCVCAFPWSELLLVIAVASRTTVVQRVCQHAFEDLGLVKIIAHVFTLNLASARVLEKCSFVQEGLLRKHFLKDGQFIDTWMYALLK